MTSEMEAGALRMREHISKVIEYYELGCAKNADAEAGRIAATVAQSIGHLVEMIPPSIVTAATQGETKP